MLKSGGKAHFWMIVVVVVVHLTQGTVFGVEYPCRFTIRNENSLWFHDDGRLRLPDFIQEGKKERATTPCPWGGGATASTGEKTNFSDTCKIAKDAGENVVCKDSIDFDFLHNMPGRRIKTLTVDSYNVKETAKERKRMNISKKTFGHKLLGELVMKDIRAELNTIIDLKEISRGAFLLQGEVFSNKIIKIGWKYNGKFVLNAKENNLGEASINSVEFENGWRIKGWIKFSRGWENGNFRGNISYNDGITPSIRFQGRFNVSSEGGTQNFRGELEAININLNGSFSGRKINLMRSEITIPKGAFANMTIENFIFKNSYFYGDFHSRSFEGIARLRTIKFSKSKMDFMPEYDKFFIGPSLKAIYIENCNTLACRTGMNCTINNLQLLSFKGSGFLELCDSSFSWLSCSNLTFLNFHDTNVKLIGDGPILRAVGNTLRRLDISYSTLRQESNIRQLLMQTKLTHLSLAGLQLKRIPIAALQAVKFTLMYLSLRKNNFEKIPGENMLVPILNFPMMTELRVLDLGECHINYIENGVFDMLANLETLDLSRNNIVNLHDGWMEKRPNILHLNLSHNVVAPHPTAFNLLDVGESFDLSYFQKLQTLDLSNTDMLNSESLIVSLRMKLRYLSLCKCGLRNLNDSVFEAMPDIEELDLSGNPSLGKIISMLQFKYFRNLNKLYLAHNGIGNLTFDHVRDEGKWNNLEYIDLSNNYIKDLHPRFFHAMPNLKSLKLSRNSISHWPKNLTSYLPSLEGIFLDNNKMEAINTDTIIALSALKEFTLGNNAYVCGRFVLDFLDLVRKSDSDYYLCPKFVKQIDRVGCPTAEGTTRNSTEAIRAKSIPNTKNIGGIYLFKANCALIKDWPANEYLCYSTSLRGLVPFVNVDENFNECQVITDPEYFDSFSLIVTSTSLFCFFLGFLWWKWWNFRFFARMIKSAAVLSFADVAESEKIIFEYDAFVSYTDSDRPWVTEKLIPTLEKLQDVKICLHERDFQVGLSILENIAKSIDKSKFIILVLSEAFVKSQWCQYEMHLAYHRLLESRRDQMILILLENIPRNMRPNTLQYLMMTTTYIQWPKRPNGIPDNNEEEIFWNRLFKSLKKIN